MHSLIIRALVCQLLLLCSMIAKAQANQAMETFSPYTPEQIKALNNQKIFPTQVPLGATQPYEQQMNLGKKLPIDSTFFNVPAGEQEAEALEAESAAPYEPMTPAISF